MHAHTNIINTDNVHTQAHSDKTLAGHKIRIPAQHIEQSESDEARERGRETVYSRSGFESLPALF